MGSETTTFEFWRMGAQAGPPGEPALQAHQERSALLHGMEKTLDMEVKDWGATDAEEPHEIVEVAVVLTPVIIPALASLIKLWQKSRRLEKVIVERPDGTRVEVGSGTDEQIIAILRSASSGESTD